MVVGTPQYMSPEQAGGAAVDGRSDQYSLACTLYEMLIGQPPFTGPSSQAVMARHSLEPVPSLRVVRQTVPHAVEGAIMQAMAKLPADRFASMQRFLDALGSPERVGPSGTRPRPRRAVRAARGPPDDGRARGRRAGGGGHVVVRGRAYRGPCPVRLSVVSAVAVLPFQDRASNPDSSYLGGRDDGGAHRRPGPDRLLEGHLALLGGRGPGNGAIAGRARAASSGSKPS